MNSTYSNGRDADFAARHSHPGPFHLTRGDRIARGSASSGLNISATVIELPMQVAIHAKGVIAFGCGGQDRNVVRAVPTPLAAFTIADSIGYMPDHWPARNRYIRHHGRDNHELAADHLDYNPADAPERAYCALSFQEGSAPPERGGDRDVLWCPGANR